MIPVRLLQRLAIRWMLIVLVPASISCTSARTEAPSRDAVDPAKSKTITHSSADTLLVRSFPTGLNTYVIPTSKLGGIAKTLEYTSDDNLVGQTPLELTLAPGEYAISIEIDPPGDYYKDGEHSGTFIGKPDKDGQMHVVGQNTKVYHIEKEAGHQVLVTALFWPEDQSLVDFVDALPGTGEFGQPTPEVLEPILKQHGVPSEEWSLLQTMLSKTGKAVWYGDAPEQYVVITWAETAPEQKLSVWPVK